MGQNWSPCTPTTLDFAQGLPGNVVSAVNFVARYFVKLVVHSYMAKKSKMATGENNLMTKSECLY